LAACASTFSETENEDQFMLNIFAPFGPDTNAKLNDSDGTSTADKAGQAKEIDEEASRPAAVNAHRQTKSIDGEENRIPRCPDML
jgi:hypothetical protein